ncbi:MAG: DNA polymerase III subunit delta [Bacteroidales bacterium]|nr:DNA polymerase III subunit delta [Candidatus Physcousia equi]
MQFNDVIGQEEVKQRLLQDAHNNRIPHALMLCGPRGVGKLPLALALAQFLLCEHTEQTAEPEVGLFGSMQLAALPTEPCGACRNCRMAENFAHPDLHFSFPIIKKKNSSTAPICDDYLAEWRAQLQENVYFDINDWLEDMKAENQQATFYVGESDSLLKKLAIKSSQGGRRVVIIWLPERMNQETANKLLKLIEEPPARTHFIMTSEEPDKVLGTIMSRTQRINVPTLDKATVAAALQMRFALPQTHAQELAHVAQGNYTQALHRMAAGNEESVFFDQFVFLMRTAYMRKIKDLRSWSDEMAARGRETQKRFLQYAQHLVRENFIYNFQRQDQLNYQLQRESEFSVRFARFINERNVIRIMDELTQAEVDIEGNVNAKMVFFDLSLKIIVLLIQ